MKAYQLFNNITKIKKIMTVERPIKQGVITSGYGNRILGGKPQFHTGVDIGVKGNPVNVPVYAAKDGVVSWINDNPATGGGFGIVVYIQLPDNWYSIYPHMFMRNYDLKIGDKVKAGDFIGIMGNTGTSTGIHIHYEERITMGIGDSREPKDVIVLYK